jgi:hypothetical protein
VKSTTQVTGLFTIAYLLLLQSLVEFICAPVPFFMGIRSDQRLERLLAEGVIVVDLDNNEIRLPPSEDLPVLADVKSRKLLHTLRKLSIWPASQRTRHSFGRDLSDSERPIATSFEPSQPSDTEVNHVISCHDDLAEKWGEIQSLFTSFATRSARLLACESSFTAVYLLLIHGLCYAGC